MSSVGLIWYSAASREVRRAIAAARGRINQVQRQVQVLQEDRVDLGLVVGEDERAAGRSRRGRGVELRGEADRAVLEVRPVDGLAVGHVELGRLLRRVRVDRRIAVGAAEGARERVVVRRTVGDEAEGGVQQLRGRVVVEVYVGLIRRRSRS